MNAMADLPVPNTIKVELLFLLFGQRVENVYYASVPGGVDAAVLSDVATAFNTWVGETWMNYISQDCVYIGLEATNLSIANGSTITRVPIGGIPGNIPFPAEPGNVSVALSLRTAFGGRSFRGRKYVAGMPVTKRTGNQVDPAWIGNLIVALNSLRSALEAINAILVVVSRIADNVERLTPLATEVLSVTVADYNIDSQRRRLTGRGT